MDIRKTLKRADSLENVLSKKGTGKSKSGSKRFTATPTLDSYTIRDIYESGGIGAKIITRVADDITRKGFLVNNDNNHELIKRFEKLKGSSIFNRAIRWARAYGGSMIVMSIKDGRKLTSPVQFDKPYEVEKLDVYEAGNTYIVKPVEWYESKYNSRYGEPKIYEVNSPDGARFRIHESRCIRLDGRPLDKYSKSLNDGWDGSELQPVYDALLSMLSQLLSGEQVLDEMVIGTLKVENLDALCIDEEGEALLRKRIDLVDTSKSNENSVVIDMNESYERHTVNLSGMSNLQQNSMTLVAGAADIPATFLYGSSPDGQNATGQSDKDQYFGKIDAERLYFYKPALLQLINVLLGGDTDGLEITFPDMQNSNFYDTARGFNHITKGFSDLVNSGVLGAEEAKSMFLKSGAMGKISMSS